MRWPWVSRARLRQVDADAMAEAWQRVEAAESQLSATRARLIVEESEAIDRTRRVEWLQEQLAESNARYERLVMRVTEKPPEPTLPAGESSLPLEVVEALDECAAGPDRAEATRLARKLLKGDVEPSKIAETVRWGAAERRRGHDDDEDGA